MVQRSLTWIFGGLLALSLAGCGGSGGSGSTGGGGGCTDGPSIVSVTYQTDWSGPATNPRSQLVSILDTSGNSVASITVNETSSSQTVQLTNVPTGEAQLRIELYSRQDLGGTKVGEIRQNLLLCQNATFRSSASGTPARVVVTPGSANLIVQQSRAFAAHLEDSDGRSLFGQPGQFVFDVLGGVGNVDATGRFFAQSAGQGSVRATHGPSNLSGAATLNVSPFNTTRSKWTILVFLNAANDLFEFSPENVNQMERVASGDVRFVLQWKQSQDQFPTSSFSGTRRYLVKPDQSNAIASELVQDMGGNVDMGQWQTLRDFIAWGKTNYPADRYGVVIWNHGNGWRRSTEDRGITRAVSYDDETGNAIQIWELPQAFGANKFDFLAWDASLMQMVEVAYEIRANAQFIIGSEESPPGQGYPYDRIFGAFKQNPTASTRTLSKSFVDGMLAVPEYASRKITQSVLDTTKLEALSAAISTLADELILVRANLASEIIVARQDTQSYSPTTVRFYRDLIHLCTNLEAMPNAPSSLKVAAANVRARAAEAIVWEGHNSNSANSRGISIDFSPANRFVGSGEDYRSLEFAQDTKWDDFLTVAP